MTPLLSLALIIAIGLVAGRLAALAIAHGQAVVSQVFGLDRAPEWPRGVQEEDPPPAWGRPRPDDSVPTSRVTSPTPVSGSARRSRS